MSTRSSILLQSRLAFVWVALATCAVLAIPVIAMLLTEEVDWSLGDFAIMGTLLFGTGSCFVLLSRRVRPQRRLVVAASLAIAFLYLWAELAVGIFTNLGS